MLGELRPTTRRLLDRVADDGHSLNAIAARPRGKPRGVWYYRDLSSSAHLSFPGLILRSKPLVTWLGDDESTEVDLKFLRGVFLTQTLCLLLALLSEVQIEAGFAFADRLKYVWRIIVEHFDVAKEIYELRYESRLRNR